MRKLLLRAWSGFGRVRDERARSGKTARSPAPWGAVSGLLLLGCATTVGGFGLRGRELEGTTLADCLRTLALGWRFPRTARAYAIEAPVKILGVPAR
jgi:hypothetical protein